jgi:hypothetical protein
MWTKCDCRIAHIISWGTEKLDTYANKYLEEKTIELTSDYSELWDYE